MTFKDCVEATPDLRGAWLVGLRALHKADRQHVVAEDARRLAGSVNIDDALAGKYPNDRRWDYAIGHRPTDIGCEMVYWVEIHPASLGAIKDLLAKLGWLKNWLQGSAPRLQAMRKAFVWISSGKTSFTSSSPQLKRLAQHGLRHQGRMLKIPKEASV